MKVYLIMGVIIVVLGVIIYFLLTSKKANKKKIDNLKDIVEELTRKFNNNNIQIKNKKKLIDGVRCEKIRTAEELNSLFNNM